MGWLKDPRAWLGAGVLVVLVLVVVLVLSRCDRASLEATTKAGDTFGQARTNAAAAGAAINDRALNQAAQSQDLSRENADAIRAAPGADQAVNPEFNRTLRERLCHRPSNRRSPDCVQLLGRPDP